MAVAVVMLYLLMGEAESKAALMKGEVRSHSLGVRANMMDGPFLYFK